MGDKIKTGVVSYLNAKPLLEGIRQHPISRSIELIIDYPARLASRLQSGTLDIALVPVAVMADIPCTYIVGDYGIAADGEVASVCLFSQVPVEQITHLYLDYQSRTSIQLARILIQQYWKVSVSYLPAPADFIERISGTTAAVVIGDRALQYAGHYPYVYDLATAWKAHTGLPFVFAAWIATQPLPADFINHFNTANKEGLQYIKDIVAETPYPYFDLGTYFTRYIHYLLDAEKRKGLALFLSMLQPGM